MRAILKFHPSFEDIVERTGKLLEVDAGASRTYGSRMNCVRLESMDLDVDYL